MTKHLILITLICFILAACGGLTSIIPDTGENQNTSQAEVYLFATNFSSSGQIYQASLTDQNQISLSSAVLSFLGSSAQLRHYDDKLYLLHDGNSAISSDNLQIIDPQESFATLNQFSTGNGTNPHDVVVVGDTAYISLYNPSDDPADVIAMDTNSGSITQRFDFTNSLQDDGDQRAFADQMVLVDDLIYVCLQDLESNTFDITAPGKLGVVDTATNTLQESMTLQGRNPVDIVASGSRLFIAHMAVYDFDSNAFDLDAPYGGIEVYNSFTEQTELFIHDEDIGGYIERLSVSDGTVFAVVSRFDSASFTYQSKLVSFSTSITTPETVSDFFTFDDDIRDVIAADGFVWVSKRVSNSETGIQEPQLLVYKQSTTELIDIDFDLEVAATSLATP